jgi:hypothetical protein
VNRVWTWPLLAAIGITAASVVHGAASPAWVTFTSSEYRFSIEMPSKPVPSTIHTRSFIGDVTSELFTSWQGNEKFTVDHSQIPRFALDFAGPDTIYDHAKGALLQQTWSKEISFVDITTNGTAGKRLLYQTPPIPGKPKIFGAADFYLVGDRLYAVDVMVPAGESEASARRYLESVRFE